jgi:bifunctional NMN adenylyltransferase/nudix hydrolase
MVGLFGQPHHFYFKNMKTEVAELAIIIGRFQTPYLHSGHLEIITYVKDHHPRVILFLGQATRKCNFEDPLDFYTRRAMIEEKFPEIEIHRLDDVGDDKVWSRNLDKMIGLLAGPKQNVVLYGSRDSFIKSYKGRYSTSELKASTYVSASEIRKSIGIKSKKTLGFREGVIWATQNDWPKVYPTVDIIAFDKKEYAILLGKKIGETLWRIPGGFSDVGSPSYEADASRELMEETGLNCIDNPFYIGSTLVNDSRYRGQDKIKTLLFVTTKFTGEANAADDLETVSWIKIQDIIDNPHILNPIHMELFKMFLSNPCCELS